MSVIGEIHAVELEAIALKANSQKQAEDLLNQALSEAKKQADQILSFAQTKAGFVIEKANVNVSIQEKSIKNDMANLDETMQNYSNANMQNTVSKILSFITK